MIVNGASRSSVSFWTKHLQNDKKNDRAELKEIRGLAATDLQDALIEMREIARYTRCTNFIYQANFSPTANEKLTEGEWQRAFEIFEQHRGIPEGQARIVYEHEKEGRVHRHVIWSRIDLDRMKAWSDSLDAKVSHAAAREISEELGLTRSISPFDKDLDGPRPDRAPKAYEMFRGLRSGLDPRDVNAEVTGIYRDSEHAADFAMRLHDHGYQLVQGDRRGFCILDPAGDVHSLARRLTGVNTKQLKTFMVGIEFEALPTTDQAREKLREVNQQERLADLATVQHQIDWEEALALSAIEKEKREKRFDEKATRDLPKVDGRGRSEHFEPTPSDEHLFFEKITPEKTYEPERIIEPQWIFGDAAREASKSRRAQTTPDKLHGTSATIWTAYNSRTWIRKDGVEIQVPERDPESFRQSLQDQGIFLASVSKAEAEESQADWKEALGTLRFVPRYKENEIVAITESGYVRQLTRHVTGHQPRDIEKFLRPLDRAGMEGIEKTKELMQDRIYEVQAFREILRGQNVEKRFVRATTPRGEKKIRPFQGAVDIGGKILKSADRGFSVLSAALDTADKLADGLLGIFDPVLTPEQKADAKVAKQERETDAAEHIDISRYTADQAITRRRETEMDRERERGRDR